MQGALLPAVQASVGSMKQPQLLVLGSGWSAAQQEPLLQQVLRGWRGLAQVRSHLGGCCWA
jgi:hypothetical protein